MANNYKARGSKLKLQRRKIKSLISRLHVLRHISKRNCALLPHLDDESLHALGEFIYNIIHQRVKLAPKHENKVKNILKKDKTFYRKLIDKKTKDPLGYFRKSLKSTPCSSCDTTISRLFKKVSIKQFLYLRFNFSMNFD
mgnify:CR=1 FL=1